MKNCYFGECEREVDTSVRIGEKTSVKVCSICATVFHKGISQ